MKGSRFQDKFPSHNSSVGSKNMKIVQKFEFDQLQELTN